MSSIESTLVARRVRSSTLALLSTSIMLADSCSAAEAEGAGGGG